MLQKSTSRPVAYAISPTIFFESNSTDTYTHARKSKMSWSFDSHIIIGHQFLTVENMETSNKNFVIILFFWSLPSINFWLIYLQERLALSDHLLFVKTGLFLEVVNLSLILSTGEPCSHEIGMDWRWTRCWLPKELVQPLFLTRRNSLHDIFCDRFHSFHSSQIIYYLRFWESLFTLKQQVQ